MRLLSVQLVTRLRGLQLLTCCLLLMQCVQPSRDELVGNYSVSYGFAEEELTLRESGIYEQRIQLSGAEDLVVNSGTWTYSEHARSVVLADPLLVETEFGQLRDDFEQPVDGDWFLLVRRSFGKTRLAVSEDRGLYFKKQPDTG